MDIYLVGGAVRDQLLGLAVEDKDWVVTNSTIEEMLQKGFMAVGKDFPVFLHPKTKEEYALARTERKTGHGYKGFTLYAAPNVTLEEDLLRRDLTINAIAKTKTGVIIDPYGGRKDLNQRVLRHVSDAFKEDPLRVLRVARFYARFAYLDFSIAQETMELMTWISQSGELQYLTPERIWQETVRSLQLANPELYFITLLQCGAIHCLIPQWLTLFSESNVGIEALKLAHLSQYSSTVKFACLFANNDKITKCQLLQSFKRLCVPSDFKELALLTHQISKITLQKPTAKTVLELFHQSDAFRKPDRFKQLMLVFQCIFQVDNNVSVQCLDQILSWLRLCQKINTQDLIKKNITGAQIGKAIKDARLSLLIELIG